MTNEEMKARIAALNCVEDAYALAKECGYTGTLEDFKAKCAKTSGNGEQMDMDAMDSVAGGFGLQELMYAWDWLTKPILDEIGYGEPDHSFDFRMPDPLRDLRD